MVFRSEKQRKGFFGRLRATEQRIVSGISRTRERVEQFKQQRDIKQRQKQEKELQKLTQQLAIERERAKVAEVMARRARELRETRQELRQAKLEAPGIAGALRRGEERALKRLGRGAKALGKVAVKEIRGKR